MEHIGYSILCINLFILFIFYIGGEGWVGRGGQRRCIMGDLKWRIGSTCMWFTLAQSSKSLIQGRTKPIVPAHSEVVLKAPNKVVGAGGIFRPRDP